MSKKSVESSKSSKTSSLISLTPNSKIIGNVTQAGWLQKWTNYLKGYRQRWFVLDNNGTFAYYKYSFFST